MMYYVFRKLKTTSICLITANMLSVSTAHALDNISYHIQYINQEKAKLNIAANFIGAEAEKTLIHMPAEGVTNMVVTADNMPTKIIDNPTDPSHTTFYVLHRRSRALIDIRYSVSQVFSGPPTAASLWKVIVNPTYFYFNGEKVFVRPDQFKQAIGVSFKWDMPPSTQFFNSFGVLQQPHTAVLHDVEELNSGLFVGGDFRLTSNSQQTNEQTIYTVIRGNWPFTDSEYSEKIISVFAAVNKFWPKGHPKRFLNTLLPVSELSANKTFLSSSSNISIGGAGLKDAFVLMATVPETADKKMWESIRSIATHEYSHNWISERLAHLPENDLGGRWFAEGVNEYMAQKLRLRAQQMTLQEYVDRSNRVVAAYFLSPAFGENINMGEYPVLSKETMFSIMHPYSRGELLAWRWTAESRGHQPIDVTLLQMMRDAENKPPLYSDKLVEKYLTRAGVGYALADIENYARQGKEIPLTGKELGPCVIAKKVPMLRYDIGFDLQKSKQEGKIVGLKQNGPAMKAGLREGDEFTHLSYDYGNTKVSMQITLRTSQSITYSPSEPVQVLQYSLLPMKQISSACYSEW
jgi:predicted metalloprotease with PDZ domain